MAQGREESEIVLSAEMLFRFHAGMSYLDPLLF